jgi:hypothetical protein
LDSAKFEPKHVAERTNKKGLSETRNAFEKDVTICEGRSDDLVDHVVLPGDDLSDFGSDALNLGFDAHKLS